MTDKYAINYLREGIITQIENCWPRTLRQWDELESRRQATVVLSKGALDNKPDLESPYPNRLLPEPASAIRLAQECNISSILPTAFYHLSRLSIDDDWSKSQERSEAVKTGSTADWGLLTADDLRCLLKGRAKMRRTSQEILHFGFHRQEWSEECSPAQRWKLLGEIEEACIKSPDVLRATKDYIEKEDYGDGICHPCHSRIRYDLGTFRYALWTMLSDFFSLR